MISKMFDFWQKARKSPKSGDLFLGMLIAFLTRSVPAWVGVWQPSMIEASIMGLGVAGLSMCFDLIPNEDE